MKLLIELDEEYVKVIEKIKFLVGGRTDHKLQLAIIKAIKNGKVLDQEPCEDAVSRKAVLGMAKSYNTDGWDMYTPLVVDAEDIEELPPVTPIRPKGHWIEYSWNDNGIARWGLECDKCHKKYKYGGVMWDNPSFCPNCGSDNREVEV